MCPFYYVNSAAARIALGSNLRLDGDSPGPFMRPLLTSAIKNRISELGKWESYLETISYVIYSLRCGLVNTVLKELLFLWRCILENVDLVSCDKYTHI